MQGFISLFLPFAVLRYQGPFLDFLPHKWYNFLYLSKKVVAYVSLS